MITENERARMRELEGIFHRMAQEIEIEGEPLPEDLQTQFVGNNLAQMDALFAIREGTEWRGHTDPKEIAREVLRVGQIGE